MPEIESELQRARALIEELAEERHMLHSQNNPSGFWNCTRTPCKKTSEFLRGLWRPYCKARAASTAGGNDPVDCDWPWCGCDPVADRVLAAIQDQGLEIVKREAHR